MERENVTIIYSEKITEENFKQPLDSMILNSLDILIDGVLKAYNPKKMIVEIRTKDEYSNDLPDSVIYEMVEKEFEKNKATTGLDFCLIWGISEYLVVAGVKQ